MARDGLDLSELEDYAEWVKKTGENWPKKQRKVMQQAGTKLKRRTLREIRIVNLKTKTGNYREGIKRGKVYKKGDDTMIRVYSNAKHAHLIEDGHDVMRNGRKIGYAPGREVFAQAAAAFEQEFNRDCENMIDEVIHKI